MVRPTDEAELVEIVRSSDTVRAVGAGHSFSPAAMTHGVLIDGAALSGVESVDGTSARFGSGTTIRQAAAELARNGLAFPNLGDIDVQTLAGAISTATHGTGITRQTISAAVNYLRIIDGAGEIHELDSSHPWFNAARASLGRCGLITAVGFECVPTENLLVRTAPDRLDSILERIPELTAAHRHFEFFWFPHTDTVLVKTMDPTAEPPRGAVRRRVEDAFLGNAALATLCTVARMRPSLTPTLARLGSGFLSASEFVEPPSTAFASSRKVRFAEMEYCVPIERAAEAVHAIRDIIERDRLNVSFPVEVRFLGADDVWMSPAFQRQSCFIAAHMFKGVDWRPYFEAFESRMLEMGGRPHPGKLNLAAVPADLYPRFGDFVEVVKQIDPAGKFANDYTNRLFGV